MRYEDIPNEFLIKNPRREDERHFLLDTSTPEGSYDECIKSIQEDFSNARELIRTNKRFMELVKGKSYRLKLEADYYYDSFDYEIWMYIDETTEDYMERMVEEYQAALKRQEEIDAALKAKREREEKQKRANDKTAVKRLIKKLKMDEEELAALQEWIDENVDV